MKAITSNKFIMIGALVLFLVNGTVFVTLWVLDWLEGPSAEEIAAQRAEEEQQKLEAVYAKLPPLEEFKSKAKHLRSIGEAIEICRERLGKEVRGRKSWQANMLESRYVTKVEIYKVFLKYQTPASIKKTTQYFEVECEVSASEHNVSAWRVFEK